VIELRAVLVMCALLGSLALLGACDAGARPEPRPEPGKPKIYVRGSEVTFRGDGSNPGRRQLLESQGATCEPTPAGDLRCVFPSPSVPCDWLVQKVPSIAFAYDAKYVALATTLMPPLLASCTNDHWPEDLKQCLLASSPQQLVHEHACDKLVTPELAEKVAKRFGTTASGLSFGP
jgi:hypothetical protein